MSELSRNAPCHCGSGKKYKHCHLDQDVAAQRRATPGGPPAPMTDPGPPSRAWVIPAIVAVVILVGVTAWRGVGDGIIVSAGWVIASTAWMVFRDPPPPNENPGDPAALNFGRSDAPTDKKKR